MEQVCRICMSSSVTLVDIFVECQQHSNEPSLAEIINECADCEVKQDDALPKMICLSCVLDAQNAFRFKKRCEESHQQLWRMLNDKQKQNEYDSNNGITTHSHEWNIGELDSVKQEVVESLGIDSWEVTWLPKQEDEVSSPVAVDSCKSDSILRQGSSKANKARSNSKRKKNVRISCPHCPKVFSRRGNLQAHLLVHSGERPFTCEYCSSTFNHPSNLKKHTRMHLGLSPLKCPYCPMTYTRRKHFENHINCGNCPRFFKNKRSKSKKT